ncbi:MAG: hypothetical protein BA866_00290 [Desulfobulbaceae bacterium S5133MH15]|nr:MAG: hypothetical protein BA866_00290 [Desulfobulbaceae bacterium S5133MH15]
MICDRNKKEVKIGSLVKVLYIDPNFILTFPPDEAKGMSSMLNQVKEVTEFAHGKALVNHKFNNFHSFSLALEPEEMELVDNPILNKFESKQI